ncbi:MAG: CoA-binding protein [Candidatus Caldatribacteriota bacterium]
MKDSISNFFIPKTVAIFGSMKEGRTGFEIVKNMVEGGFKGELYPISQSDSQVLGLKTYSDFKHLDFDLAIIAIPAASVPYLLEDLGKQKVPAVVVISAGFSETGNLKGEEALIEIARKYQTRIIGPNCAGVMNTSNNLFASIEVRALPGNTAFITQSGALGGAVLMMAEELGFGFSKFVSYGNRCDVDEADLIDYLREDSETRVIAIYIEGLAEGKKFLSKIKGTVSKKPIIAIKSGKFDAGKRATSSHTGSLAGEDRIYEAAFKQFGVLRVEDIEEMFDLCRGLEYYPRINGKRIAIITNAGGPAVMTTDKLEALGLEVTEPSSSLIKSLKGLLPPHVSLKNPFDLLAYGSADTFTKVGETIAPEYDALIVIFVPTASMDSVKIAHAVGEIKKRIDKPIFTSFMAGRLVKEAIEELRKYGIPNYSTGERCARVIQKIVWHTLKNNPK